MSNFIQNILLFDFAAKTTKESRNAMKMKRTLNCNFVFVFKAIPDSNDLFWKSQFNENEKDFQPSFWLYFQSKGKTGSFNDVFLKSHFKWKWKGFSTVILRLFSKRYLDFSSWWSFWKVVIQWNEKDFPLSFCLYFH